MKKKRFDLDRLMNDWVIPLAIVAAVVWLAIWISGGGKPKAQETVTPAPTEEPVIVQMRGACNNVARNLQLCCKNLHAT